MQKRTLCAALCLILCFTLSSRAAAADSSIPNMDTGTSAVFTKRHKKAISIRHLEEIQPAVFPFILFSPQPGRPRIYSSQSSEEWLRRDSAAARSGH